jgi:hypothetical protein
VRPELALEVGERAAPALLVVPDGLLVPEAAVREADGVRPGASARIEADLVTCVKVDQVRAYLEIDGLFDVRSAAAPAPSA